MTSKKMTKKKRTRRTATAIGWHTTDEHEIELRRERGREEISDVGKIDEGRTLFGAYRVPSASGEVYVVEIRSLTEPVNSCGCADHQANALGTCKHVEGVLHHLQRRRGYASAVRSGNPRTELFLDRRDGRPAVQWAVRRGRRNRAEQIVAAACAGDGSLVGVSSRALKRMYEELAALPATARAGVRVSRYLEDWQTEAFAREKARRARQTVEQALDAGKPALDLLKVPLYPYQRQGVLHLAYTGRAILADEMGLGKTIQAVGACELLARHEGVTRVLIVAPASLKGEWAEQIGAFTDRDLHIVDGPPRARAAQYRRPAFFHIVNYEQVRQDLDAINELLAPEVVVLDEAQRIKNWRTLTANRIKRLRSRYAFVLTGTPLENRIDEIYSISQFLDPALFGSLFRFNREFYVLDDRGRPAGYRNLDEMHRRLQPVMLRRRKEEIEGELPGRSVTNHFVALSPEQEVQYEDHRGNVARLVAIARRRPLRKEEFERLQRGLACMRMACDTPFILDRETRVSPKLDELVKLLEEFLDGTTSKAVVFSEWERMLVLARERTARIAPDPAWHTGATPQKQRRREIRRFREDPDCRILFSTDSGSVGLNLQVADVVINLDLPWNPARLEQRIARAWRKHQKRHVRVVNLISEDTIEHRMLDTLEHKRQIAESVIDGRGGKGTVALRSGRAALIERVEALAVNVEGPASRAGAPAASTPSLRTTLERALGENLVDVHRGESSGGGTSMVVVTRSVDADTRETIERCASASGEAPHPLVEVVDAATWQTITRLARAGLLRLDTGEAPMEAPAIDEAALARRRERVARAGKALDAARRQHAMARLLIGGGFEPEAKAPLRDGFDGTMDCLRVLCEDDGEPKGARLELTDLVRRFELPGALQTCRETLNDDAPVADVRLCLSIGDQVLEAAAVELSRVSP